VLIDIVVLFPIYFLALRALHFFHMDENVRTIVGALIVGAVGGIWHGYLGPLVKKALKKDN